MDILISNSSGKPIYEQISSQIKNLIITGQLKAGDTLPSMRYLAKELHISVITTKRAYQDLERDGFIESVPGKGSFVSCKHTDFIREEHLRMIEDYLQNLIDIAKISGISLSEIIDSLTILYKGDD